LNPNLCYGCKKKPPLKEPEIIQINGLLINIKPFGLLCIDCLKKGLRDDFEQLKKQGKEFVVKESNGTIAIDWKIIDRLEEESQNFAYDILLAMDIFSLSSERNWQILADGGIILNPRHFLPLYFKKEQDAINFAAATLNRTLYSWALYSLEKKQVLKVITKSEIIMGQK